MYIDILVSWASLYLAALFFSASSHACGAFIAAFAAILFFGPAFVEYLTVSPILAASYGVIAGGVLGLFIFLLLRVDRLGDKKQAASRLLASFGLHLALINGVILVVGDDRLFFHSTDAFLVGNYQMTWVQVGMIVTALLLALGWRVSRSFRAGLRLRAIFDDPRLASAYGLDVNRVRLLLSVISGAGLSSLGIAIAADTGMAPLATLSIFFMGAIAYILGDRRSLDTLPVACLALVLILQAVTWFIGGGWREAVALSILLVILIARQFNIDSKVRNCILGLWSSRFV